MAHTIGPHLNALHNAGKDEIRRIAASTSRGASQGGRRNDVKIPDPRLFQALGAAPIPTDCTVPIPSISECAVHLELLEVFYYLRVRVLQSTELDAAFGVCPNKRTVFRKNYSSRTYEPVVLRDGTFEARRRAKWRYFLDLAVMRFMRWARARGLEGETARSPLLPPLDILMVWHALLLNPVQFRKYCADNRLVWIRKLPFPWPEIHKAIDSENWLYTLPSDDVLEFACDSLSVLDLFRHLAQVGRTEGRARAALSGASPQPSQATAPGGGELPPVRSGYITSLRATETGRPEFRALRENVERQVSFVDKMHAHLWIRSPAVEGTLCRAIDRYVKFLRLFKHYPDTTLVPTLDIDLVWHTHQCSPEHYRHSMAERTGRFINHDDTIGQQTLDDGMDKTAEFFLVRFGQDYKACKCWDCEAVVLAIEESVHGDRDGETPLEKSIEDMVHRVRADVNYYRARELERRLAKPLSF
ncbi:hypothetical protein McanMca71_003630 [Microsporum canis]|uniref:Glycine-rich domain-containing protein 1 n=1 Tax=Arthroderma otae (strain ATCC MYA-4605 / CBS 113480) TaxID=554155 RepID=C5FMI1_ARTOC|nr:conserved hypothetical protein [Microsporum canis CBS 113480]EEQ31084.1 conserved hypothetical protein [Microsporum canis CBS 113480]